MRLNASLCIVVCVGALFLCGVLGCSYQPEAAADGYASADVQTWRDTDGDGKQDPGESPLPWVTIQMAYEVSITNSSGQGRVGVFKPGCARKCWEGEVVSVKVPPGYRATTPVEVDMTGEERTYGFGFQLEEGARLSSFPNEPDWFQAFPNRGLNLVGFHYAVDDERLTASFDTTDSRDPGELYRDVFDVIRILEEVGGISVKWVELTTLPTDDAVVCEMSQVEAWTGRIPPAEIVANHCQHFQLSTATPMATRTAEATPAPEAGGSAVAFRGHWCFDSRYASFDMQLVQTGDRVSGSFFLLKYCEVEQVRSACRIREGEIVGTVKDNQAEITLKIPEYGDAGTALLTLKQDALSWNVREAPQEYYLPTQFELSRCTK